MKKLFATAIIALFSFGILEGAYAQSNVPTTLPEVITYRTEESAADIPEVTNELVNDRAVFNGASSHSIAKDSIPLEETEPQQDSLGISAFGIAATATNIDPYGALFIDASNFGAYFSETADADQRWYCFSVTGLSKIALVLADETDGDYDIQLYRVDNGSLTYVAESATANALEQINYLANAGDYYIGIIPYQAASAQANLGFVLNVLGTGVYDQYEFNANNASNDDPSNIAKLNADPLYMDNVSISANIDNSFDVDWYAIEIPYNSDRKYR